MSEIATKNQELANELAIKVGTDLANEHSDIVGQYFPYWLSAKNIGEQMSTLRSAFEKATTDVDKIALANDAEKIKALASPIRGKGVNGMGNIKPTLKSRYKTADQTINNSHNTVEKFVREIEANADKMINYPQVVAQRKIDALTDERKDQIDILGGLEFITQYKPLGEYSPEEFDAILSNTYDLIEAKNIKAKYDAMVAIQEKASRMKPVTMEVPTETKNKPIDSTCSGDAEVERGAYLIDAIRAFDASIGSVQMGSAQGKALQDGLAQMADKMLTWADDKFNKMK